MFLQSKYTENSFGTFIRWLHWTHFKRKTVVNLKVSNLPKTYADLHVTLTSLCCLRWNIGKERFLRWKNKGTTTQTASVRQQIWLYILNNEEASFLGSNYIAISKYSDRRLCTFSYCKKWQSFINKKINPNFYSFALYTNKQQYLDTLHSQQKTEMHLRMHFNDFDILLISVHYSGKLNI